MMRYIIRYSVLFFSCILFKQNIMIFSYALHFIRTPIMYQMSIAFKIVILCSVELFRYICKINILDRKIINIYHIIIVKKNDSFMAVLYLFPLWYMKNIRYLIISIFWK